MTLNFNHFVKINKFENFSIIILQHIRYQGNLENLSVYLVVLNKAADMCLSAVKSYCIKVMVCPT